MLLPFTLSVHVKKLRPREVKGLLKGHRDGESGARTQPKLSDSRIALSGDTVTGRAQKTCDKTKTGQLGPRPRAVIELSP